MKCLHGEVILATVGQEGWLSPIEQKQNLPKSGIGGLTWCPELV